MLFIRLRALRATVVSLIALLLTVAVVSGQAPTGSAKGTTKGFLWKFERGGRIGWLVGSLHLLTPDFYPLPDSMEGAFTRADTLVEEIDINEAGGAEFAAMVISKAMYPSGTTLAMQVSRETYKALAEWLSRAGLGVEPFQQMKPWMVSLAIQSVSLQRIGFDPAFGIDKHFQDASTKAGKRFIALETAAEQIEFLDRLSPKTQDLMLRESIETADAEQAEIKSIASAWRSGDAAAVERIALGSLKDAQEVYQSLLVDRNRRWIPKIEACVQGRSCFVVVGAAHLVGPDGLVALLKQRGYTVEQQ